MRTQLVSQARPEAACGRGGGAIGEQLVIEPSESSAARPAAQTTVHTLLHPAAAAAPRMPTCREADKGAERRQQADPRLRHAQPPEVEVHLRAGMANHDDHLLEQGIHCQNKVAVSFARPPHSAAVQGAACPCKQALT